MKDGGQMKDRLATDELRRGGLSAIAAVALLLTVACAEPGEIEPPRQLGEIPVEYPIDLWDADVEGEALLRVLVSETGGVDSVEIVESAGHAALDSAAIKGARELRFTPARRDDGRRVDAWTDLPVNFSKRPRLDTLGIGLSETRP